MFKYQVQKPISQHQEENKVLQQHQRVEFGKGKSESESCFLL